jgi:hypothetical protein
MGTVVQFPSDRIVRRLAARSSRIIELERRILELMRVLRQGNSQDNTDEILRLRDEVWRLDTCEEQATTSIAWPRGH